MSTIGDPLYDPGGDVGARKLSSPTIQGRRKEALNRSLTAPLGPGGNLMSEGCPALNPSGAEPSVTMRMCGRMYGSTPSNWSQTYWSISQGGG
jgi:hypothetical protein